MTKYDGNEAIFAMFALQEVPDQYRLIKKIGLLDNV